MVCFRGRFVAILSKEELSISHPVKETVVSLSLGPNKVTAQVRFGSKNSMHPVDTELRLASPGVPRTFTNLDGTRSHSFGTADDGLQPRATASTLIEASTLMAIASNLRAMGSTLKSERSYMFMLEDPNAVARTLGSGQ